MEPGVALSAELRIPVVASPVWAECLAAAFAPPSSASPPEDTTLALERTSALPPSTLATSPLPRPASAPSAPLLPEELSLSSLVFSSESSSSESVLSLFRCHNLE